MSDRKRQKLMDGSSEAIEEEDSKELIFKNDKGVYHLSVKRGKSNTIQVNDEDLDEITIKQENTDAEQEMSEDDDKVNTNTEPELCDKAIYNVSIKRESTETEERISDGEEIIQEHEKEESLYTGKDGKTIWYSNPDQVTITERQNDPIKPGVKPYATKAKSELDCWILFINNKMLAAILKHTNAEIKSRITTDVPASNRYIYKDVKMDELMALFGLMYIAGLNTSRFRNFSDLWQSDDNDDDDTGDVDDIAMFKMTIPLPRFNFLQKCLRFDDATTRKQRLKKDNIAEVRRIFENFTKNCQKAYKPSDRLALGEIFTPYLGKCSFRQQKIGTGGSYGIKMYTLVDAKTLYTVNLEIHAGDQPDGPFFVSYDPFDVVNRLVAPVSTTNRNVTLNDRFTSIPLAQHLLTKHGLTITGELSKEKEEIPLDFIKNERGRACNSARYGFQDDLTLLSYAPKKSKVILLLSSLHHDDGLKARDDKQIPEIVKIYNDTENGVKEVDNLCSEYDIRNLCKRWPPFILFNMLKIAAINSFIVYRENNKSEVERSEFIRNLGLALIKKYLSNKKNNEKLPRDIRKLIYKHIGETPTYSTSSRSSYRRCKDCPASRDRKTKHSCVECHKPICFQHFVITCKNCSS